MPREEILLDLTKELNTWIQAGEHVILMMDCNEDVRSSRIQQFLHDSDLQDVIHERHGTDAPPTYKGGKVPIDGIFASRSVNCTLGGYTSFDEGVQGKRADHRCLWIDVKLESVFGHKMPPLICYAQRRVKTNDPRITSRFNQLYRSFLLERNMPIRALTLEAHATYPLHPTLCLEAEKLDRLKVDGVWYADQRCRRLFMGNVPFSPEYKRVTSAIGFWNAIVHQQLRLQAKNRTTRKQLSSRLIQRYAQKARISKLIKDIMCQSVEDNKIERSKAYDAYKDFKKRAWKERQSWLRELAQARATVEMKKAESRTTVHRRKRKTWRQRTAAEITQLQQTERSRNLARRIKNATGPARLPGISLVIAPDHAGNWKECTKKEDIEDGCIWYANQQFRQTEDTPFMLPPLVDQFGYLGVGPQAKAVLAGTYTSPSPIDPYAARLLQGLQTIPGCKDKPLRTGIQTSDFVQGWSKAKEQTSAGPSQIHFGHCKTMARDPLIATFEAAMASIPMKSGYAYKRWRKGIDVELLKKTNSFRVDKLRTIVLFEADFNFTNKSISNKVAT
jgi:hypothetical protein